MKWLTVSGTTIPPGLGIARSPGRDKSPSPGSCRCAKRCAKRLVQAGLEARCVLLAAELLGRAGARRQRQEGGRLLGGQVGRRGGGGELGAARRRLRLLQVQ